MKFRKLTDKQLAEVLNAQVEEMDPKLIIDMFDEIMDDLAACNGVGFSKKFSREEIMAAILLEMYKKGFAAAMVLYNEAVGELMQKGNKA